MTKVRMEWTLAEFYGNGGVTRFVDRLAASLGINANRIKTVAVYEGSTVVDFTIEADENDSLAAIKQNLVSQVEEGTIDLGAPIMGLQGDDGEVLAGDPIPGPADLTFGDTDHSAIVGDDENLWDHLIFEQEVIEIEEPATPATEEPIEETSQYETSPKDTNVIHIQPF